MKPLRDSKSRLSHILSTDERAELTATLLARTLKVLGEVKAVHRTLVVSRDPAALKIARAHKALTFGETEKQDLNTALTRATHVAAAQQANCVLILPSDLPFLTPADVEMMVTAAVPEMMRSNGNGYYYNERAVSICTDHNQEGTNALLLCPPTGFNFQYGPGSFKHHLEEAARLGMSRRIVHAPGIKFDLDTQKDWATYLAIQPEAAVSSALVSGVK
ncbi:MAG: 2-phospho-L-lactate guanylyltransferase [Chloroflexi bacterium]|nr:2-phospho-L-lactate guanylyltransferase [Chloroflexota bacterium]MCI0649349.1 2-phospho-L-lactate guanylyltransferase [Chloroflexota bacterium]